MNTGSGDDITSECGSNGRRDKPHRHQYVGHSSHTSSVEFTKPPFLSSTEPTVTFPLALLLTVGESTRFRE